MTPNECLAADIASKIMEHMTKNNKLYNSHLNPELQYKGWKFWHYDKIENRDPNFNYLIFRLGAFKQEDKVKRFIKICCPGGETEHQVGGTFDIELKDNQRYIFPDDNYNEFEIFLSLILRTIKFIDQIG